MDSDIILREDIAKLWSLRDDHFAVMCVKHEHRPANKRKFMNSVQIQYEKKNWSSVMLFNNPKCKMLTLDYVNTASGQDLHQFKWLGDDALIGSMPLEWNYLADYTASCEVQVPDPSLVHYTNGGPFFPEFIDCEYSAEWFEEFLSANYCKDVDFVRLSHSAAEKLCIVHSGKPVG